MQLASLIMLLPLRRHAGLNTDNLCIREERIEGQGWCSMWHKIGIVMYEFCVRGVLKNQSPSSDDTSAIQCFVELSRRTQINHDA